MSKRLIFVDFNGVISYKNFWDSIRISDKHIYKKIDSFLFRDNFDLVRIWMKGKKSSEEIHQFISEELNISFEYLFSHFKQDCETIDISNKILNNLESIKENFYLILRTDNMDSFTRFTLPANPRLSRVFDEIDNSFELKELKRENNGYYFTNKARKYNLEIKDCLLIDDSSKNCDFFNELGGTAYCLTGEETVVRHLATL